MKVVVVPNELSDAIHSKITEKLNGRPITDGDRQALYEQLLEYFDVHGRIPDFELEKSHE